MNLVKLLTGAVSKDQRLYLGFEQYGDEESRLPRPNSLMWHTGPSTALDVAFRKATAQYFDDSRSFPKLAIARLERIPPFSFMDLDGRYMEKGKGHWRKLEKLFPVTFFREDSLDQLATHYTEKGDQEEYKRDVADTTRLLRNPLGVADEIMDDDALLRATFAVMHQTWNNPTRNEYETIHFAREGVPEPERRRCFNFLTDMRILEVSGHTQELEALYRHVLDGRHKLPGLDGFLSKLGSSTLEEVYEMVRYIGQRRELRKRDLEKPF